MKKSSVYLFVVLAFVSLGLTVVPTAFCQASQAQNLKVISYSYYFANGNLIVVGVVQNNGSNTITNAYITGSVIDSKGVDQADSASQLLVQYITPQGESPFYMTFNNGPNSAPDGTWGTVVISNVDFSLASSNATSNYQYPGLQITKESGSVSNSGSYAGAYMVNFTIKNTGSQTAQNIWVVGTFYNSTGTVIGIGYTPFLTPASLAPSQTVSYFINALDLNQQQVPQALIITSYTLTVQSAEPVVQGSPPPISTNSPPSTPQSTGSNGSTNKTEIYAIVAVVVILVVAGTVLALRKRKPNAPATELKEAKKAGNGRTAKFFS